MLKKIDLKTKKILVTGGKGFLGSHLIDNLINKRHVPEKNIRTFSSKELDLRKFENCVQAVKDIDIIIHLAAKVGGIGANEKHPGSFFYDNLMMGVQLMEAARLEGVEKFVGIGTICSYPKFATIPFNEDELWDGYPEETNAPYGLAKKMLIVQSQAYKKEYGFNSISLLPVNMYGPGDNFNPNSSHVIPALIKKISDAKIKNKEFITAWGTGKATREFLYVEDGAEGIILATEQYNKIDPVNIGANNEISIKHLTELLVKLMNFNGEIKWDATKPDGQPRRKLNTSKAENEFGFKSTTSFENGLKRTIDYYLSLKKI